MNSVLWDGCELWMCSSEVFREEVHNWRSLRRDLRQKVEKNDTWPETVRDWFEIRREREIGDKKRWRRRGRRRLRWEWWCEDPVCRMSQIKFLLLSCLFILQLCESNSTQKWGRILNNFLDDTSLSRTVKICPKRSNSVSDRVCGKRQTWLFGGARTNTFFRRLY